VTSVAQVMVELGCQVFGKPEVAIRRWKADWSEAFDAEGNPDDASKAVVESYLGPYAAWVKTWKAGVAAVAASSTA
jgi:hypothetical protein